MVSPFEEAQTLWMRGQSDAAIRKFSEALNGDFFNEDTLFYLGSCFQAVGQNGLSAVLTSACIDARIAKKLPYGDALQNLAMAYKAEQKIDQARQALDAALKQTMEPRNVAGAYANIGSLYVNEGCPELAVPWCDKALEVDPTNFNAQAARGL